MDSKTLLEQLRSERAELDATITVLEKRFGVQGAVPRTRKSTGPKRHGRVMSAAAKAAMSRKLKAVWAAKKAKAAARSKVAKARVQTKKGA